MKLAKAQHYRLAGSAPTLNMLCNLFLLWTTLARRKFQELLLEGKPMENERQAYQRRQAEEAQTMADCEAAVLACLQNMSQAPRYSLLVKLVQLETYERFMEADIKTVLWSLVLQGKVEWTLDLRFRLLDHPGLPGQADQP
jgi:hypothetical protein